jgi:predicted DsbA family dithiol-disulfide isomerase
LYDAYWQEGADLGDAMTLADIAVRAGLGRTDVAAALADPEAHAAIAQEADVMRAAGVSGVPTFIVNERTGFSGALAPASLAEALQHARRQSMETA